ncbi:MAG: glycosyltransferase family 4 protein [Kiritimatiellia bacterium]|nr:glycosyltransferase family 4 protein [Kiritimatiellia bacterium]
MKIIICSPLLSFPGHFLRVTKERADCIRRTGIDVTVVGFRESFGKDFSENKLPYISVEASLPPARRRRIAKMSRRFGSVWFVIVENFWATLFAVKYAREHKADIVYITDLEPWVICLLVFCGIIGKNDNIVAFVAYPYFDGSNIRIVVSEVPVSSLCRALLNYWLAPFLTRWIHVICESQFLASKVLGRNVSKVHIVPDGLTLDSASKEQMQAARRQLGIPPDKRVLLFFGVASQTKGAQILYEALDGLEPDFVLLIVGTINSMFRPRKGSRERNLSRWKDNIIRVPRFVSEEERKFYFMACDAVVLAYCKGFCVGSGALQSAIIYGKAVIASDQYRVGHLVRTHGLGLLFPPEDVEKLRNCLREFAAKPDSWFDEIEQRSKPVALEYSWENVGVIYKKTFEAIVAYAEDNA